MPRFEFVACKDCGQPIIRRGTRVMNPHGTPIDHRLSCTGPETPDAAAGSCGQPQESERP